MAHIVVGSLTSPAFLYRICGKENGFVQCYRVIIFRIEPRYRMSTTIVMKVAKGK